MSTFPDPYAFSISNRGASQSVNVEEGCEYLNPGSAFQNMAGESGSERFLSKRARNSGNALKLNMLLIKKEQKVGDKNRAGGVPNDL